MFGSLDTSTSALVANRQRMEVIAANIAGSKAMYDQDGNFKPFRRRIPLMASGNPATGSQSGVHLHDIVLDNAPLRPEYDPTHPHADEKGFIYYSNVDPAKEMVNALEASRAYEANITAAEATKSMIQSALRLMA